MSRGFVVAGFGVLLLLCSLSACDSEPLRGSGSAGSAGPREEEAGRKDRRERVARAGLEAARVEEIEDKLRMLADVAHLYGDTAAGAEAWRDLVFWSVQRRDPDYGRAVRELAAFRAQVPPGAEHVLAAGIATKALVSALEQESSKEERSRLEALRSEALASWIDLVQDLADDPELSRSYPFHLEAGEAFFHAGRYEDALSAWARIETLDPPVAPKFRVRALLMRADLLWEPMGERERALEIYRQVESLLPELDETTREIIGEFVEGRLRQG